VFGSKPLIQGLVGSQVAVNLFAIGVIVCQRRVHVSQSEVGDLPDDLFRGAALYVPPGFSDERLLGKLFFVLF
jgi:hypothetical protein